jgi:hypothetical protein
MKLALWSPFSPSIPVTQEFGQDEDPLYAQQGLKGHSGRDYGAPWGSPIPNCVDGAFVSSLMNVGNPDLSQYRAVFTVWHDPQSDGSYATSPPSSRRSARS